VHCTVLKQEHYYVLYQVN